VDSGNFYWASRLLGALADPHFGTTAIQIERYQDAVANKSHELLNSYDAQFLKEHNVAILDKANAEIAAMTQKETDKALDKVLFESSSRMKNGYARSDN